MAEELSLTLITSITKPVPSLPFGPHLVRPGAGQTASGCELWYAGVSFVLAQQVGTGLWVVSHFSSCVWPPEGYPTVTVRGRTNKFWTAEQSLLSQSLI